MRPPLEKGRDRKVSTQSEQPIEQPHLALTLARQFCIFFLISRKCVCACTCVHAHMNTACRDWKKVSCLLPSSFMGVFLSLSQALANSARLAGQQALGTCLPLPPLQNYSCTPPPPAFVCLLYRCFACVSVCAPHVHCARGGPERTSDSLELQLQTVGSLHMGGGAGPWIFCKSNACS